MRLLDIERKARSVGIKDTWKFSKINLVRNIQRTEGNQPCFAGAGRRSCEEMSCCWRSDCVR